MIPRIAVSVLLALFVGFVLPSVAHAQAKPDPRTISVSGESAIYVTPDEVVITVGVETFHASLDRAREENDARSRTLLAAIKNMAVEEKHIQTDDVRISIDYHNDGPSRGIDGYLVHRDYTVKLKDPKKTEGVVDAALKNGANVLQGIEYRSSELRKHRDEARRMAVKAAKEKATLLVGELGEQLGRPRTISEGAFGYYGWAGRWNRGSQMMAQNSFQVQDDGAGIAGETIPIGQIAITATVSITFDLRD